MPVNEKEKRNPLFYLFAKMWEYSVGNRKKIGWFVVMFIVARLIDLFCLPILWANIMDVIQKQGIMASSLKTLFGLLVLTFVTDLVFWSFHGPARILERMNAFKARINYRKYLLKGIMTLPVEWHVDHHSGDTNDKVEKGAGALYRFSEGTFTIIYCFVELVGSFAMLVYFSSPAAIIVTAMILVTVWITMRFDRVLLGQYKELNHAENKISEKVLDSITNIMTVIILRVEQRVFKAIVHKLEKPLELFRVNIRLDEFKWFLTNMCCNVMTVLVLGIYFWQHLGTTQGVLVGSVYLLIQYLNKISQLFFRFTEMYGEILQHKSKVMNAEELAKDFKPESFTNHVLPSGWKTFEVKGLDFSYHSDRSGDQHLTDISLSITRGAKIAFVGDSGDGKTTLLKLIRDLYHPRRGNLFVDGKEIKEGFRGIARAIALVPQSPEIFATTIRDNITIGADYDMAFIRRFTDMACFTDVVEKLPKKFDSSIRERGVNLSGGQQQRLALSRGLLTCHDKDIVLLDEPTSSVDMKTEMQIYRNIFRGFEGKVIISSVHRLHLLALFDCIYVFEKGRIIGSGTLAELLRSCPKLATLWQEYMDKRGV